MQSCGMWLICLWEPSCERPQGHAFRHVPFPLVWLPACSKCPYLIFVPVFRTKKSPLVPNACPDALSQRFPLRSRLHARVGTASGEESAQPNCKRKDSTTWAWKPWISRNVCHNLGMQGTDSLPLAVGRPRSHLTAFHSKVAREAMKRRHAVEVLLLLSL